MSSILGCLVLLGILNGCASNEEKVEERKAPPRLIPEENMIPIIIDLQLIESHYHRKFLRPDAYKEALDSASYFVFEEHGVTRGQFDSSFTYYSYDVDKMYKIYETALDTLNIRISLGV